VNDSVVVIVGVFFIIGITVGIIAVVAFSVLRTARGSRLDQPLEYEPGRPDQQATDPEWDGLVPDDRPRWPGDADDGFAGR
jgi:hypothetical protein